MAEQTTSVSPASNKSFGSDTTSLTNSSTKKAIGGSGVINSTTTNHTNDPTNPQDLNMFVSDLLEQMQDRFQTMGESILNRMDDMGSRIDELEHSIGELMDQAGLSEHRTSSASTLPTTSSINTTSKASPSHNSPSSNSNDRPSVSNTTSI